MYIMLMRWEEDVKIIDNEGLFEEYLKMSELMSELLSELIMLMLKAPLQEKLYSSMCI